MYCSSDVDYMSGIFLLMQSKFSHGFKTIDQGFMSLDNALNSSGLFFLTAAYMQVVQW
jgi:hypothetical protein